MDDLPTIAIRLADEGVPVCVIARGLNVPSTELFERFNQAIFEGRLIAVPRADWIPSSSRRDRTPTFNRKEERATLLKAVMRVFDVTMTQSRLVLALIQRAELSREQLYEVYTQDSEVRAAKVQICKIRKKLDRFGLKIKTSWGNGWSMSTTHRERALGLVMAALED